MKNGGYALGSPDGNFAKVGALADSELVLDLGAWLTIYPGMALAVYERAAGPGPGILQDQQVVSVGGDRNAGGAIVWTVVYIWGDETGEDPDTFIPEADLHNGTAFLIDLSNVDHAVRWIRFQNYPAGVQRPPNEQVEVDAVEILYP